MIEPSTLRELASDALKYWERRRILYNLLLAAIVLVYFVADWPVSKQVLSFNPLLVLFTFAVVANIFYCAVYILDVFVQMSAFREQRNRWRFVVLWVGFIFAQFVAMAFFHGNW